MILLLLTDLKILDILGDLCLVLLRHDHLAFFAKYVTDATRLLLPIRGLQTWKLILRIVQVCVDELNISLTGRVNLPCEVKSRKAFFADF